LTMIMNGNTSKSVSAFGWLAVLALGLLLPLVPVNAQQQSPNPQDDRRDPRDQQIETLKKMIQALEQQNQALQQQTHAEKERHIADVKRGADLQQERAKQEMAQAEEQRAKAVRFLEQEMLAQNRDPEQRRSQGHRLNIDEASPGVQKAMHTIEEITKMIEIKRQELRGLEEKLRQLHADLEQSRAEGARGEAERRVIRVRPDEEIHREPIIIKVDPFTNPEQIKAQVEAIQGKLKQPIRVEIVRPEPGPAKEVLKADQVIIRNRTDPAAEPRSREPRDVRADSLEQKLEKIMKEVEELRRELRSGSRK